MRARNADLERDIAKMSIAVGNENIRNEMKLGDMQIKIKLVSCSSSKVSHNYFVFFLQLQDALTSRNKDLDLAEDNN